MVAFNYIHDTLCTALGHITNVIIATDSSSLIELCYRRFARKGHPIEFYELWEALYGHALRDHTYVPLDFRFWLVPERMNQEAYIIADCRLNPEMHDLGDDCV
jgi:hypothetical protein